MPNYRIVHPLWIDTLNARGEEVRHHFSSVVTASDIYTSSIPSCLEQGWIAETPDVPHAAPEVDPGTKFPDGWSWGSEVPPVVEVVPPAPEVTVQAPQEDAPNPDLAPSVVPVAEPATEPESAPEVAPEPEAAMPAEPATELPSEPAHEGTV